MMTHSIPSAKMEEWVKKVAKLSGQPVDWHFVGGRARILALGDLGKVREAIMDLIVVHNDLQKEAVGVYSNREFQPDYLLYDAVTN